MRLLRVLLVVWVLISSPPVNAESIHKTPEEPQFTEMVEWELHYSLGIVATFLDGTMYSFPILAQYPVAECNAVKIIQGEVYLMSGNVRYVIRVLPMLYRKPPNDWEMYDRQATK